MSQYSLKLPVTRNDNVVLDEIELKMEKAMSRLDRMLMDRKITQDQYDREVYQLDKWAKRQLKAA